MLLNMDTTASIEPLPINIIEEYVLRGEYASSRNIMADQENKTDTLAGRVFGIEILLQGMVVFLPPKQKEIFHSVLDDLLENRLGEVDSSGLNEGTTEVLKKFRSKLAPKK